MSKPFRLGAHVALFATTALAAACITSSDDGPSAVALTPAQCSGATPWGTSTAYVTGAVVTYAGATYQCLQGHTSQADWTPSAVPALWAVGTCAGGSGPGVDAGPSSSACNPTAWVYMGDNPSACTGHLGESCGWTSTNLGQGYHCQLQSWGAGCSPGGATCPGGGPGIDAGTDAGVDASPGGDGGPGPAPTGLVFGAYKDTSINMDWNTNVASTMVSGSRTPIATDLVANGSRTITLAFASGECGSENWGGVPGAALAAANVPRLTSAGIKYIVSTGGAAGSFTCGSDTGFASFVNRWASPNLIGVDLDIEAGQSQAVITELIRRLRTAHGTYPGLRFSLTIATLANNNGATTAQSLGPTVANSLSVHGVQTLDAVRTELGFNGTAATWPSYLTVNLMTMDYGAPGPGVCVVSGGLCNMGESALQAAHNLHDRWGVPYSRIELTPMIGGNDVTNEHFTLADVDTVSRFAIARGLAGVHYWSYDRDTDCAPGPASPTCNSLGGVGAHGFLRRFLAAGLR